MSSSELTWESVTEDLHVCCVYDVELRALVMLPSAFLKMCSEKKEKNKMFGLR